MLFPPVIYFLFPTCCFVFLFVSWTNQAALKRDAGCMRDGNCWGGGGFPRVKRSLVFTSKNTPSSSTSNTKYQKTSPAVYSPHVPFPLETTRIFSPHTRSPLPPTQRECFKVVLYMEKTKKSPWLHRNTASLATRHCRICVYQNSYHDVTHQIPRFLLSTSPFVV